MTVKLLCLLRRMILQHPKFHRWSSNIKVNAFKNLYMKNNANHPMSYNSLPTTTATFSRTLNFVLLAVILVNVRKGNSYDLRKRFIGTYLGAQESKALRFTAETRSTPLRKYT